MPIIVSKEGKKTRKLEPTSFGPEESLQKYIYEHPDSIPLYEIKEDIRLLILAREFPTDGGSIDAVGTDKDGEIYVIETKLYKNPDKRIVVAQVLDYGASLWHTYSDFNHFVNIIEDEIKRKSDASLVQTLKDFFGIGDEEVLDLLDNMRRNLNDGAFKFVVLMDRLHSKLKDLVTFINQKSQFTIYAVEMEFYKYEDYEILIPRLYGAEVRKDVGATASPRRRWDEKLFFEDVQKRIGEEGKVKIVKDLYEFSKANADEVTWGTGAEKGSFNVKFSKISARSLFSVFSDGRLRLSFGWLTDTEDTLKFKEEYRLEVQKIREFADHLDSEYPEFHIDTWSPIAEQFIETIKKLTRREISHKS